MTSNTGDSLTRAEIRLPTQELRNDIPFYTKVLGMRMDMIYPADDPRVAVFSGHGLRLRIEKDAAEAAGTLRILTNDPDGFAEGQRSLVAPNGTRVELVQAAATLEIPTLRSELVVTRAAGDSVQQAERQLADEGGRWVANGISRRDGGWRTVYPDGTAGGGGRRHSP